MRTAILLAACMTPGTVLAQDAPDMVVMRRVLTKPNPSEDFGAKWVAGEWTGSRQCSPRASETRTITCQRYGKTLPDASCSGIRPDATRSVERYDGCERVWTPISYGEYDKQCSDAATRTVEYGCLRRGGDSTPLAVDASECTSAKPAPTQTGGSYAGCDYAFLPGTRSVAPRADSCVNGRFPASYTNPCFRTSTYPNVQAVSNSYCTDQGLRNPGTISNPISCIPLGSRYVLMDLTTEDTAQYPINDYPLDTDIKKATVAFCNSQLSKAPPRFNESCNMNFSWRDTVGKRVYVSGGMRGISTAGFRTLANFTPPGTRYIHMGEARLYPTVWIDADALPGHGNVCETANYGSYSNVTCIKP